ncbi:hypothetical protein D9M72_375260 [compost metagenome]
MRQNRSCLLSMRLTRIRIAVNRYIQRLRQQGARLKLLISRCRSRDGRGRRERQGERRIDTKTSGQHKKRNNHAAHCQSCLVTSFVICRSTTTNAIQSVLAAAPGHPGAGRAGADAGRLRRRRYAGRHQPASGHARQRLRTGRHHRRRSRGAAGRSQRAGAGHRLCAQVHGLQQDLYGGDQQPGVHQGSVRRAEGRRHRGRCRSRSADGAEPGGTAIIRHRRRHLHHVLRRRDETGHGL